MPKKKNDEDEDELEEVPGDFDEKARELDYDPWGGEEDDAAARRRDPFRRPGGAPGDEDAD